MTKSLNNKSTTSNVIRLGKSPEAKQQQIDTVDGMIKAASVFAELEAQIESGDKAQDKPATWVSSLETLVSLRQSLSIQKEDECEEEVAHASVKQFPSAADRTKSQKK